MCVCRYKDCKEASKSVLSMRVQCPTCLEEFTPEDDLQCPPCGHVFHRHCVQEWFDYKRAGGDRPDCPQCRKVTNVNKLMKIYLAEVECDSQEERERNFQRQIEDIKYKLEFKEGENNSLLDRVETLESNLIVKAAELNKNLVETNYIKNDQKVLIKKLLKFENEIEENEKLKGKWLKSKKMLQELEEKQGQLKIKLRQAETQRIEEERRRKEGEKGLKDAEVQRIILKKKMKELYIEKKTLEEELEWLEEKRAPTMRMKLREAEIQKKEQEILRKQEEIQRKEEKYCLIGTLALCSMPLLLYLAFKSGLLRKDFTSTQSKSIVLNGALSRFF